MRSTFRILFYINTSKEKRGMVPIMGRITINGTVASFSCKYLIEKELWCAARQKALGRSSKIREINNLLELYRAKIAVSYQKLLLKKNTVTALMVKNEFLGTGNDYTTLLQTMDEHIHMFELLVGKERSVKTLNKMLVVRKHIYNFISSQYGTKDIFLSDLNEQFIFSFSSYLNNLKNLSKSSGWVYCTFLKKVVREACRKGLIDKDPFRNVKLKVNIKERGYLTEENLKKILHYNTEDPTMKIVLDAFVFSCFTGLSFIDLKNLTTTNLTNLNGEMWITTRRQKNNMPCQIKLMKIPTAILNRHSISTEGKIFNLPSYECTLKRIKKLGQLCGIDKPITFHTARHTFATMALTNGMPIESISRILGHSNITTTQIYAKVINLKLLNDITSLEQKIDIKFKIDK